MESTSMNDIFNHTKIYIKVCFLFIFLLKKKKKFLLCQFEFIVFVKAIFTLHYI